MPLLHHTHGKGRVRVMRLHRDGPRHTVRELSVQTMLEGDFALSYTEGDNRGVIATDTIKNLTNILARQELTACAEEFAQKLAKLFLARYPQVDRATVTTHETKWARATIGAAPHPHSFVLDANGQPYAHIVATRDRLETASGVRGYTFMKSTESGWVGYLMDDATTLRETTDRIAATAMDATWRWAASPPDYEAANAAILGAMLDAFATTYSHGIQDSLYRMGEAALAAAPDLHSITMACPNKHYIPIDLAPFGLSADNAVFTPTDEPHGQIECTVGR